MRIAHKNVSRIHFADQAALDAALADDALRAVVLRVIDHDMYVRPDDLGAALGRLEHLRLWYSRQREEA